MASDNSALLLRIGSETNHSNDPFRKALRDGLSSQYIKVDDADFPAELAKRMADMAIYTSTWPSGIKQCIAGFKQLEPTGSVDSAVWEVMQFAAEGPLLLEEVARASGHSQVALGEKCQWPDSTVVGVNFQNTIEEYMFRMRSLYREVLGQLEVALELPRNALRRLDSASARHTLSIVSSFASTADTAYVEECKWLTFVKEIDGPNLQIRLSGEERWVHAGMGSYVGMTIGNMFEKATSCIFRATDYRFQPPIDETSRRHSVVFAAGLPQGISVNSLKAIFSQSPHLQKAYAAQQGSSGQ